MNIMNIITVSIKSKLIAILSDMIQLDQVYMTPKKLWLGLFFVTAFLCCLLSPNVGLVSTLMCWYPETLWLINTWIV